MRRATGLAFLIALLAPGCNIAYYAGHNLVNEPGLQCGQHALRKRARFQAAAAWAVERDRRPACPGSAAYADGFVDGYADYVMEGGPVQTPVAPPPEYRRHVKSLTAAGQAAQREYMAGFRHGAAVAAGSGCREVTLVALNLKTPGPEAPPAIVCEDAAAPRPASPPEVKTPPVPMMPPAAPVPLPPEPGGPPPAPRP